MLAFTCQFFLYQKDPDLKFFMLNVNQMPLTWCTVTVFACFSEGFWPPVKVEKKILIQETDEKLLVRWSIEYI